MSHSFVAIIGDPHAWCERSIAIAAEEQEFASPEILVIDGTGD